MYVFSVNATAKGAMQGVEQGQRAPFIVYINAEDKAAAEKLCALHLLRAGFHNVEINKHKKIAAKLLGDHTLLAAHPGLKEALDQGYSIHLFDED